MKLVKMSVGTFSKIADNPRQRDTVRHARKACKWLKEFSDTHAVVSVAELPDGSRFKLDGHTRCYLWEADAIPLPEKLNVLVFPCETMEDIKVLYTHFDNTNATENASDRLSGACREHGLELKSNMLKSYDFAQAMKCVNRSGLDEYELVGLFRDTIEQIDGWLLPQKRALLGKKTKIHTCVKALAIGLLEAGEDPVAVHAFVSGVVRDEGTIKAGSRDGIAWASELWLQRANDGAISGWDNLNKFLDELLWCYRLKRFRKNAPGAAARKQMAGEFRSLVEA